jgi:hypothetical protein
MEKLHGTRESPTSKRLKPFGFDALHSYLLSIYIIARNTAATDAPEVHQIRHQNARNHAQGSPTSENRLC